MLSWTNWKLWDSSPAVATPRAPRGGLTAYSLRHPKREDLATAIEQWAAANHAFQAKAAAHRAADLAAFAE